MGKRSGLFIANMQCEDKNDQRSDARPAHRQKTPPPEPPRKGGWLLPDSDRCSDASHSEFVQADVLNCGPDDGQATGLRREHVDLIGALPHEAPQTLNGIGRLHVPVQRLRKGIKRKAGALRPRPGFVPLLDSAQRTWRFSAASWVNASCFVGWSQMPTSSAWTSPRSRLGIALSTLRCL